MRAVRDSNPGCASSSHADTEFPAVETNFDLSRSDIENLLTEFLSGSLGTELGTRLTDPDKLPAACRSRLQPAQNSGQPWTAWSTPGGPMVAWGRYDLQGSRRLTTYLLFVEWWEAPSGHHALWCHCDPKRPGQWTVGPEWRNEPR